MAVRGYKRALDFMDVDDGEDNGKEGDGDGEDDHDDGQWRGQKQGKRAFYCQACLSQISDGQRFKLVGEFLLCGGCERSCTTAERTGTATPFCNCSGKNRRFGPVPLERPIRQDMPY